MVSPKLCETVSGSILYRLNIPNREVQLSLNALFIDYLTDQQHEKIENIVLICISGGSGFKLLN